MTAPNLRPPRAAHLRAASARRRSFRFIALAAPFFALCAGARTAAAQVSFGVHVEGAAARAVGEPKASQFGWGGSGLVGAELTLADVLGLETVIGGVALSDGAVDEPGLEPTGAGSAFLLMPGVRLHPFGRADSPGLWEADGLWLAGGGGLAVTGVASRPALGARIGYDVHAGPVRLGPYGGFVQIVEPASSVRPDDARVVLFGVHASFGADPLAPDAAPEPNVRGDRDPEGRVRVALVPDVDLEARLADGDRCPRDEETQNGYTDDDGCPDAPQVRVDGDLILLDDRLHFQVDEAEVELDSWSLLEHVAALLKAHSEYALVRIQGHADDTGDFAYNQRLSLARSRSVRTLLVRAGVAPERLVVQAFGNTRPALPGKTSRARHENRRVEFEIIARREIYGE